MVARNRGTLMHFHIEMLLNGGVLEEPQSPEILQFRKFERDVIRALNFFPYRTEVCVFHLGLRVAGQIDALFKHEDGTFAIFDWKRSAAIRRVNDFANMDPPLDVWPDCNYYHYTLQLNMYRYILQTQYGLQVRSLHLGVFHPDRDIYEHVVLPLWDEDIERVVAHEMNVVLPMLQCREEENNENVPAAGGQSNQNQDGATMVRITDC